MNHGIKMDHEFREFARMKSHKLKIQFAKIRVIRDQNRPCLATVEC